MLLIIHDNLATLQKTQYVHCSIFHYSCVTKSSLEAIHHSSLFIHIYYCTIILTDDFRDKQDRIQDLEFGQLLVIWDCPEFFGDSGHPKQKSTFDN